MNSELTSRIGFVFKVDGWLFVWSAIENQQLLFEEIWRFSLKLWCCVVRALAKYDDALRLQKAQVCRNPNFPHLYLWIILYDPYPMAHIISFGSYYTNHIIWLLHDMSFPISFWFGSNHKKWISWRLVEIRWESGWPPWYYSWLNHWTVSCAMLRDATFFFL